MKTETLNPATAKVKADKERIDRLKEQLRSTTPELDFERVRIMHDMYEETVGEHQQHTVDSDRSTPYISQSDRHRNINLTTADMLWIRDNGSNFQIRQ